jgi:hypothetical protein
MYVRMDVNGCDGGFEEVYGRTEFIINKHLPSHKNRIVKQNSVLYYHLEFNNPSKKFHDYFPQLPCKNSVMGP